MSKSLFPGLWLLTIALLVNSSASADTTLNKIKAAHELRCGINFEEAEYSTRDAHGNHSALDLDICKAIAVAVLGRNAKFVAAPYRDEQDALQGTEKWRSFCPCHGFRQLHELCRCPLRFF
jgi:general L-amino acid transport system substrate-binding protein